MTEERFPGADLPVVEISSKAKDSDGAEQDGLTRPAKKKVARYLHHIEARFFCFYIVAILCEAGTLPYYYIFSI